MKYGKGMRYTNITEEQTKLVLQRLKEGLRITLSNRHQIQSPSHNLSL